MLTNTLQLIRSQGGGPRSRAARPALAGMVALTSVVLMTTGPAHARIETPADTGGSAVLDTASAALRAAAVLSAEVPSTRVTGLYGIHVGGGWLLR